MNSAISRLGARIFDLLSIIIRDVEKHFTIDIKFFHFLVH